MPRYYFDTFDGPKIQRDQDGLELPDLETARKEALTALPDIAREVLPGDGNRRDIIIDVRDETGRVAFTAMLSLVARKIG